jgi:hypothetical protein
MEITKLKIDTKMVLVDYSTEAGDFRIKTEEDPSQDLLKALAKLKETFVRRMQFESVKERTMVTGFESGKDDTGQWYRITGIYTANLVGHKITTPKIRESNDPEFWEGKEPEEWPGFLNAEETELMLVAVQEAEEFVRGKRAQLPLEEGQENLFGEDA